MIQGVAKSSGLDLKMVDLTHDRFENGVRNGLSEWDIAALVSLIQKK